MFGISQSYFFGCLPQVAEDLYQAGFISYPRTETDSFSSRTDLHVCTFSSIIVLAVLIACLFNMFKERIFREKEKDS